MRHFERSGNADAMFFNPYANTNTNTNPQAPYTNPVATLPPQPAPQFPPPLPTGSLYPPMGGAPQNPPKSQQTNKPTQTNLQQSSASPMATNKSLQTSAASAPTSTNRPPVATAPSAGSSYPMATNSSEPHLQTQNQQRPAQYVPPAAMKARFVPYKLGNDDAKRAFDDWLRDVWWAPRGSAVQLNIFKILTN